MPFEDLPCHCYKVGAIDCPRHDGEVYYCSKDGCAKPLDGNGSCREHPSCADCGESLDKAGGCPYRECPGKAA